MIEAKDLRIGNWAYSPIHKKNGKVVAIEIGGRPVIDIGEKESFTTSFSGTDCIEGISITPAILIACGFEDLNGEFAPHFKKEQMEIEVVYGKYMARLKWDGCPTSLWLANLNHIHQLQNLYFALTGNEIDYQPK